MYDYQSRRMFGDKIGLVRDNEGLVRDKAQG